MAKILYCGDAFVQTGFGRVAEYLLPALAKEHEVHVLLERPPTTFRLLKGRTRRQGPVAVLGQVLFQVLIAKPQHALSRGRITEIFTKNALDTTPIPLASVTAVDTVNSMPCWNAIQTLAPKVVVINGTRILSRRTLEHIPVPVLNMHVGITPRYRGVHGAYWALVQGEPEHCGVTVHLVDEGVDTGAVLYQTTITPTSRDNFSTYPSLQLAAGIPLLIRGVQEALSGKLSTVPGAPGDTRWFHPTLWQYLRHRFGRGVK